ncbi:MAG: helix-turn-helix domain-containing protein [Alphaproteobacteria bacterium]|nr:helix-turn-helix domain-containing protein [Alphaproteobacteria bacterium]MDE2340000.1 helix-turn-helix domain-containing protein [Alphaproteobacteria bacterium]
MPAADSNKAKIAMRVIEVLEFFDEDHPRATVMDIARRFNRPQSSTSELLSKLVDLGLLYKDCHSRSYTPTPRVAMLGTAVQPSVVRSGRLTDMIDRLCAQTGLAVAVFGMVGPDVQIFHWRSGSRSLRTDAPARFMAGQLDRLSASAAGWLLLSTIDLPRRDGLIWRLNAEASESGKFSVAEMSAQVRQCREAGAASGRAGFGSIADVTAVLLPDQPQHQPLALGLVYEPSDQIDRAAILSVLRDATNRCGDPILADAHEPYRLYNAA